LKLAFFVVWPTNAAARSKMLHARRSHLWNPGFTKFDPLGGQT
jgi:hypothetical protein